MLKRIGIQQLQLGMFLEEFCGSWMDHPFWRSKFLLKEPKDLERILASPIREVWIDTSKGDDVAAGVPVMTREQVDTQVDSQLIEFAELDRALGPTPLDQEVHRAAAICLKSKRAVTSMFQEARMGRAINSEAAQELVTEISDSVTRNPSALISLARLKTADDYTYMHSVAVCALMVALGRQLGLKPREVRQAGLAGLLHDVGKMAIPMEVLRKPGRLTDAEFTIVRNHPVEGYRMLQGGGAVDAVALDVCLHHHEKVDGSGYPEGLKADQISLFARMGAVCDVYDAITSNRPYKSGWDPAESIRKMAEWANGHFDPQVFQAFVKSVGIYPVGSLVRLASGRLGVVVEQGQRSLTQPKIKVFYSTNSKARIPPEVIDLARPGSTDKIVSREDPALWRFPDLHTLWSGYASPPHQGNGAVGQ